MNTKEKQMISYLQKCKKDIKLINSLDKFVIKKHMKGVSKTNTEIDEINKDLNEIINFFEKKI